LIPDLFGMKIAFFRPWRALRFPMRTRLQAAVAKANIRPTVEAPRCEPASEVKEYGIRANRLTPKIEKRSSPLISLRHLDFWERISKIRSVFL